MFSSDLTPRELSHRLGHMCVPTLAVLSCEDEYVPPSVKVGGGGGDMGMGKLARLLCDAMPGAVAPLLVEAGDHALSLPEAREVFLSGVEYFARGLVDV
ncbi:unnamed protein product [Discosporangium mesarthrocarpum]